METLSGADRKFLRGRAHHLKPAVMIGHQGIHDGLIRQMDQALADHELIKIKFLNLKKQKQAVCEALAEKTGSHWAGLVGHVAVFYRRNPDPEKRLIKLPFRKADR